MFVNFSEEVRHILKQAEKERADLNHPYVGSEHLLLSLLKNSKLKEVFEKRGLTYNKFKNKLIDIVGIGTKKSEFILYTPLLKRILENSIIEAREDNNKNVTPEILVISILDSEDGVANSILKNLKINIDKLYYDIKSRKYNKSTRKKKSLLDELATDLTKLAKEGRLDPVIGRDKEISRTIEILLRRKKNNPILIGPAGVGKTAIVEEIANLIAKGKCPNFLKHKRIISLNIFSLVSGTKYRGEFEEKLKNVIRELEENDDIILFIDEIHTMVGAGGAEGAIDASNILKPSLARGTIKIIGATTLDEYKKFIEPDSALSRRFQNVMVNEPNKEDVVKILMEIRPLYEKYHNIIMPKKLINELVNLTDKYLSNRYEPDRSIDILDEVCAKVSITENYLEKRLKKLNKKLNTIKKEKIKAIENNNFKLAYSLKNKENNIDNIISNLKVNKKIVTKENILDVIKLKSNINLINIDGNRKEFYKNLEDKLNSIVIGQNNNVKILIESLKKKEVIKKNKCYSVFIYGKKYTGKTLLAKEFLKELVNEKSIINIDLSLYKEYHMISKLIGTTAGYLGYDNKNNIFEKIRTNPNSALIIDNYEDACLEVKNLFIKILEDRWIEDASGKMIDFSNSIIIFTSKVEEEMNSLGFDGKEKDSFDDSFGSIKDKVSVCIKMNNLNECMVKKIIRKRLNDIVNSYINIDVKYDDSYEKYLFDLYKEKKSLPYVLNKINNSFENKIADALINYKNNVLISANKGDILV